MKKFLVALLISLMLTSGIAFAKLAQEDKAAFDAAVSGIETDIAEIEREATPDNMTKSDYEAAQKKLEGLKSELEELKNDPDLKKAQELEEKSIEASGEVFDDFIENDDVKEAAAAKGSLLPGTNKSLQECRELMKQINWHAAEAREQFRLQDRFGVFEVGGVKTTANDVLACGIKTGDIKLWMVPYYVKFFLEFVLNVAGIIAVAGLVYGGYLYLFAGVTDAKEQGKKAIMYAIAGYIMTLVAWAFVNIILALLTNL